MREERAGRLQSTQSGVGSRMGCVSMGDSQIDDALAVVGAGNSRGRGSCHPAG